MRDTEQNGVHDAEETAQDVSTASTSTEVEEPAATGRPRRRRAASRPAGPPPKDERAPETSADQPPEPSSGPPDGAAPRRPPTLLFQAAEPAVAPPRRSRAAGRDTEQHGDAAAPDSAAEGKPEQVGDPETPAGTTSPAGAAAKSPGEDDDSDDTGTRPRRRRRGGRGRRGRGRADEQADDGDTGEASEPTAEAGTVDQEPARPKDKGKKGSKGSGEAAEDAAGSKDDQPTGASTRRRRRRRRGSDQAGGDASPDDPERTVVRVREPRPQDEDVQAVKGSTRLEAKKQRRREGRAHGRRRVPVITEAEFLARRESVDRAMVVRRVGDRIQVGVLEDGVLVEHYVSTSHTSTMIGNVYLGKVQNVLPSMEAAFVDIGRGRNAVLYAGEVNFDLAGLEGQPKRIESALKSGQSVLVQVTKEPIGQKGARLTSQVSLPGRYLVYVPEGSMTGISRKLPDKERARLKSVLGKVVPEGAGVIVRTAAEGASEDELARDVARLEAQWKDISKKSGSANAPALLYSEPDLAIRVVRDVFNEDFSKLVVAGDEEWDTLSEYVRHVAPELAERMTRWTEQQDVFAAQRIDEQITKALDRKVWLPSGGSLVIDRTEAMTVIDVNTGKFTGKGGNLEETVTKNNLEAAEEIVRQLRLRDVGGIIVIDFIDMVLESNRDLVLRRLLECLGRDRTKHQVAEVTSLGLVQMTRKRVGQGLLEAFSEPCEHCGGRGVHIHTDLPGSQDGEARGGRRRRGKGDGGEKVAQKSSAKGGSANASTSKGSTSKGRGDKGRGERGSTDTGQGEKDAEARRAEAEAINQIASAARDREEPASVVEALEPEIEPVPGPGVPAEADEQV